MDKREFIFRVELRDPMIVGTIVVDSGNFSSLAAIFDVFSEDQIGCKLENLWNHKIGIDNPYMGKKCTITKECLVRKKQGRVE